MRNVFNGTTNALLAMKRKKTAALFSTAATCLLLSIPATTQASLPSLSITPISATTVTEGRTGSVRYTLTNKTNKTQAFTMQAMAGVTATPASCTLKPDASCEVTLQIDASKMTAGVTLSGPRFCTDNAKACDQPYAHSRPVVITACQAAENAKKAYDAAAEAAKKAYLDKAYAERAYSAKARAAEADAAKAGEAARAYKAATAAGKAYHDKNTAANAYAAYAANAADYAKNALCATENTQSSTATDSTTNSNNAADTCSSAADMGSNTKVLVGAGVATNSSNSGSGTTGVASIETQSKAGTATVSGTCVKINAGVGISGNFGQMTGGTTTQETSTTRYDPGSHSNVTTTTPGDTKSQLSNMGTMFGKVGAQIGDTQLNVLAGVGTVSNSGSQNTGITTGVEVAQTVTKCGTQVAAQYTNTQVPQAGLSVNTVGVGIKIPVGSCPSSTSTSQSNQDATDPALQPNPNIIATTTAPANLHHSAGAVIELPILENMQDQEKTSLLQTNRQKLEPPTLGGGFNTGGTSGGFNTGGTDGFK